MRYENKVDLIGDVVHVHKNGRFALITIRTVYGSRVPNYPQVRVYGELAEKVNEELISKRVKVEGYYVSEKRKGKKENNIVGTSLELVNEKSLNEVRISGYIVRIEENVNNTVRVILKVKHGKYINIIETFLYTKEAKEVLEKYKKGDMITVLGNIQTKKRVYPDVVKYYSDITLREMRKIEEE